MKKTVKRINLFCVLQLAIIQLNLAVAETCNYNSPGYTINRFADNNDGTVNDSYTGLTWQRCIMGKPWSVESSICGTQTDFLLVNDWKTALQNVITFNNAEFSKGRPFDWRMPNIKELASIINLNCYNPAIDASIFFVQTSYLWSSTPSSTPVINSQNNSGATYIYENYIWGMGVVTGREFRDPLSSKHAVLLVRGISEK